MVAAEAVGGTREIDERRASAILFRFDAAYRVIIQATALFERGLCSHLAAEYEGLTPLD